MTALIIATLVAMAASAVFNLWADYLINFKKEINEY
jgi:hypothetical protein